MVERQNQVALALGEHELSEEAGVVVAAGPGDQGARSIDIPHGPAELSQVAAPDGVELELGLCQGLEYNVRPVVLDSSSELARETKEPIP